MFIPAYTVYLTSVISDYALFMIQVKYSEVCNLVISSENCHTQNKI